MLHKSGFKKKKSISDLTNCSFCHCKWPRFPSRIGFLGYVIVGVISELVHEEIVRNFMRQGDGEVGSSGEAEGEKAGGDRRERHTHRGPWAETGLQPAWWVE